MKIYDCFTYCGEDFLLDTRLNILNKDVDFFVIIEMSKFHSGKERQQRFNINKFLKFKKKIRYYFIENTPNHDGDNWKFENFQRNQIKLGLFDAQNEDIIIVSDLDEIPNLTLKIHLNCHSCVFLQNFYYFKLNNLCFEGLKWKKKWPGSKSLKFKFYSSAQEVREQRVRNIAWWRIDKKVKRKVIENGGWHFSYLMTPEKIAEKIYNFAHKEFKIYSDIEHINKQIRLQNDIFLRKNLKFKTVKIDESYPEYIQKNINKFDQWILKN